MLLLMIGLLSWVTGTQRWRPAEAVGLGEGSEAYDYDLIVIGVVLAVLACSKVELNYTDPSFIILFKYCMCV